MNRYERLLEDILIFENDPLRAQFRGMTPGDAGVIIINPLEDTVGDWFIGFGTSWLHGLKVTRETKPITIWHAFDAAQAELYDCLRKTPELLESWGNLSNTRQNVVVQMVYQLGFRGVSKFKKMLMAIEEGDFTVAAIEMLDSKWAAQTQRRAVCLAERMETNLWKSLT